jgi:DNA-binding response OmpR family regulator
MGSIKIVIVEDEYKIVEIIRLYLEQEDFTVYTALNATEGLRLIESIEPDVVLLDVNLPEQNGFELARRYREISNGILIFITGEKTKDKIIQGFEIGCDDYVTKPFDPPELIARIKANIRRFSTKDADVITIGDLSMNMKDMSVWKKGKMVDLFTKERMLVFYLAQHPNQVFSAEHLYDIIWGMDSNAELKTVSVHISTLRKKIEDHPSTPKYIVTVRGFGYKFAT